MFTLGCDRAYLYAHPERELSAEDEARYGDAPLAQSRGVPSQYITGHQEFWGLDFIVSPAVLIPRPETEHVVETVLELAQNAVQRHPSLHKQSLESLDSQRNLQRKSCGVVDVGIDRDDRYARSGAAER